MMLPYQIKAVLNRAIPFDLEDFREIFRVCDGWQAKPQRFGVVEPIRKSWGSEIEFLSVCKQEISRYFGTIIVERKNPTYLINFVIKFGPTATCHSVWFDYVNPSEFGGTQCPVIIEFLDQLFESLGMDYGFACSNAEYDSKNLLHNVQVSQDAIRMTKVVGMDWPDCIPGFYWCNYFGENYFKQGFGESIAKMEYVHRLKNGFRVMSTQKVSDWESADVLVSVNRGIDNLGANWFFSKDGGMPAKSLITEKALFRFPPQRSVEV